MRAIMVMYDSLRRDMLPCYGGTLPMPNFDRLAAKSATFDKSYVCSLPCMPARRELHTGRPNLLHRSWGPLEPFDDSMPEILKNAGIHSHLATDHYHYFEDGGCTYHGRYTTYGSYRGQESDAWIGDCAEKPTDFAPIMMSAGGQPEPLRTIRKWTGWQSMANRSVRQGKQDFAQAQTFEDGLGFMRRNSANDNWFLQIETFDPHEPFDAPDDFLSKWFDPDAPFDMDWPPYAPVTESEETVQAMRKKYMALAQFCDESLGRVLDLMDGQDMWKDTMLIVNTDHGFALGEHGWWGKNSQPDYQEIVNTPLFIWDPRAGVKGEHRQALVQTIDLAPTLLEYFGQPIPKDMLGVPLGETVKTDAPVRDYALFGMFGSALNVTDGTYVYMRAVQDAVGTIYEHTFMPTHMRGFFSLEALQGAEMCAGYSFTKGRVMRVPSTYRRGVDKLKENRLYNVATDPGELAPLDEPETAARMEAAMLELFKVNEAPKEIYTRYGFAAQ